MQTGYSQAFAVAPAAGGSTCSTPPATLASVSGVSVSLSEPCSASSTRKPLESEFATAPNDQQAWPEKEWERCMCFLNRQQTQALEVLTERVDIKVGQGISKLEAHVSDVEARLEARIESLTAGIRDGSITSTLGQESMVDTVALEDQKDILLAITSTMSSICRDMETLKCQHREQSSALELLRNQQVWSMQELSHLADGMKELLDGKLHASMQTIKDEFVITFNTLEIKYRTVSDELQILSNQHAPTLESWRNALEETKSQMLQDVELIRRQLVSDILKLQGQQSKNCSEIEAAQAALSSHCNRNEDMHKHLATDVGFVRTQLMANLEALKSSESKHRKEMEALREEQGHSVEALRVQQGSLSIAIGGFNNGKPSTNVEDIQHQFRRHSDDLEVLRGLDQASRSEVKSELRTMRSHVQDCFRALQEQQRVTADMLRSEHSSSVQSIVACQLEAREKDILREIAAMRDQQSRCLEVVQGQHKDDMKALRTEQRSLVDEIQDQLGRDLDGLRKQHSAHLQHVEAMRERHEGDLHDVKQSYVNNTSRFYVV